MVGFRVPGTTALVYMDSGTISCTYRYYCPYTITEMPQTCDRATSRHLQMFTVFIYIIYIYIHVYIYMFMFRVLLINHCDQSKPVYHPIVCFFCVAAESMERYVNLTCALCGENLYTDLCDFVEAAGSQPHLDRYLGSRSKNSSFHGVSWFPQKRW